MKNLMLSLAILVGLSCFGQESEQWIAKHNHYRQSKLVNSEWVHQKDIENSSIFIINYQGRANIKAYSGQEFWNIFHAIHCCTEGTNDHGTPYTKGKYLTEDGVEWMIYIYEDNSITVFTGLYAYHFYTTDDNRY